ncbi:MAG: M15 family metallopeptidase [Leucobacter sp.]
MFVRVSKPANRGFAQRVAVPLAFLVASGLLLSIVGCSPKTVEPTPSPTQAQEPKPTEIPEPEPTPEPPSFDKSAYSIDDPNSIWVVANKLRQLNPAGYVPNDLVVPNVESTNGQPLRQVAATATEQMVAAAAAEGISIYIISAYRSYDTQVSVYGGFVANQGQAFADTTSARPGHSEHQTGLSVDFAGADDCMLDGCFANTPAGQWLHNRSAEFGFTERYPFGYDAVTGYMPEPWHYRYVGTDLALELKAQGILTLEEFFGLPPAPDYAG